jgi:hypothetical protein
MEKVVYTWDIFTELSIDFFRVVKEIETMASRRFGATFEVSVRVSDLKGNQGGSSASNEPKPSTNASSLHLEEQDEAYVIIAKNISAKSYHQEVNALEKVQRHDFERKFREKQFRDEMKQ